MSLFTDFVRQLEPGGPGPSADEFDLVWEALRGTLSVEMKRRSAWQTRPSFLGVLGHIRWVEPGTGSDGLDELTSDCFEFVFIRRRDSLRRQAERKSSIDGLVLLSVRHFLFDAQKRHDPLGFRIFEILRDVTATLVASDRLWVISGSPKIRNATLLATHPGVAPEVALQANLSDLVESWTQHRLQELVESSHRSLTRLITTLGEDLMDRLGPTCLAFRFGDLAAPLKQQVRLSWAAMLTSLPEVVTLERPEEEPDQAATALEALRDRRQLKELILCMERSPEWLGLAPKTRQYLDLLWSYLKGLCDLEITDVLEDIGPVPPTPGADKTTSLRMSLRQLAEHLGIPRARLPELFGFLQSRWNDCQRFLDPQRVGMTMDSRRSRPPLAETARGQAQVSLADSLAAPTAVQATQSSVEASGPRTWSVGDLFELPTAAVDGVDWLILHRDPTILRLRCAPVDTCTLLGSQDLDLSREVDEGEMPFVVRRGFTLSLAPSDLSSAQKLRNLGPRVQQAIEKHRAKVAPTSEEDSPVFEQAAYRDWLEEGPACAHRALRQALDEQNAQSKRGTLDTGPSASGPPQTQHARPAPWLQLVAATLVLAFLGLSWRLSELGKRVETLSQPIFDLPYREIQFTPELRSPWHLRLPQRASHIQLGFILIGQPDFPRYRLHLVKSEGVAIFLSPPMMHGREYDITIPIHSFGTKPFEARLFGLADDGTTTLLKTEEILVTLE